MPENTQSVLWYTSLWISLGGLSKIQMPLRPARWRLWTASLVLIMMARNVYVSTWMPAIVIRQVSSPRCQFMIHPFLTQKKFSNPLLFFRFVAQKHNVDGPRYKRHPTPFFSHLNDRTGCSHDLQDLLFPQIIII